MLHWGSFRYAPVLLIPLSVNFPQVLHPPCRTLPSLKILPTPVLQYPDQKRTADREERFPFPVPGYRYVPPGHVRSLHLLRKNSAALYMIFLYPYKPPVRCLHRTWDDDRGKKLPRSQPEAPPQLPCRKLPFSTVLALLPPVFPSGPLYSVDKKRHCPEVAVRISHIFCSFSSPFIKSPLNEGYFCISFLDLP